MKDSKDIIKHFEAFCRYSGGNFNYDIYPKCSRLSFSIILEFSEKDGIFERFSLKIESTAGDYEVLRLENIKILDIQRFSEEGPEGIFKYYTMKIVTDKGVIFLKKYIREDKLVVSYEGENLKYESSIVF